LTSDPPDLAEALRYGVDARHAQIIVHGETSIQDDSRTNDEAINLQKRMEALAPVLRTLPPGTQVAFIQEGDELRLYNVNKAIELFGGRPPTIVIDVAERAKRIQPRDAAAPPEDAALIDPDHAAAVDLSYPVMLLESHHEMDGTPGRVIDGWHRIYRAAQLGIPELPAIAITAEEEALIRIEPGATSEPR
jgi:hypothetical protein